MLRKDTFLAGFKKILKKTPRFCLILLLSINLLQTCGQSTRQQEQDSSIVYILYHPLPTNMLTVDKPTVMGQLYFYTLCNLYTDVLTVDPPIGAPANTPECC